MSLRSHVTACVDDVRTVRKDLVEIGLFLLFYVVGLLDVIQDIANDVQVGFRKCSSRLSQ